jgi:hypothetical protein
VGRARRARLGLAPLTGARELVRETARFRPWVLLSSLEDLAHLGGKPGRHRITVAELDGPGALRYLVSADDGAALAAAILHGAARRLGRPLGRLRDLGADRVLVLHPEEQYLVATGRTHFRGLAFDDLRRLQLDLETTGLAAATDRIFLVALRDPDGRVELLEAAGEDDRAEAELLLRVAARVRAHDPDVIENHNLHGFDLPFLVGRADRLGVALALARIGPPGLRSRPSSRGTLLPAGRRRLASPCPVASSSTPSTPSSATTSRRATFPATA